MTRPLAPYALLLVLGAGWGLTQPMAKIAVSEGYRHFGLIFWQLVIGALVLGPLTYARGRGFPRSGPALRMCLLIALIGTVLPNSAGYEAARHLPSGILSIVLSMVPMLAFPIALGLGNDRFSGARLAGLCLGLLGVALIALPQGSLPDRSMVVWLPVALIGPAFYALEGNVVAKWGTVGMDPIQLLFGASVIGAVISLPLALASGEYIDPIHRWGAPDYALVISSLVHAAVYATYVWLVGRAGSVFAAQVSYLVTGFGVVWAMLILGERYSLWVWAAFGVMIAGLALVRPRGGAEEAAIPAAPEAPAAVAAGAAGVAPMMSCESGGIGQTRP